MKTWKLILFLTFVSSAFEASAADEIHWTITGQTSVTFDWRGEENTIYYDIFDADGTCLVSYTDSVTATTPTPLPDSSSGPFREAKILGLVEGKRYCYAIGAAPGGASGAFQTPPPAGSSDFIVYAEGDIGSSNSYPGVADVQSVIAAGFPDFVLVLGDLSYGDLNGADDVDQHFNDLMVWSKDAAYMAIWGNHDWHTSASTDQLNNYKGRFDFPNPKTSPGTSSIIGNICSSPSTVCSEDWYWFDYGNVRFIAYPEKYDGAWSDWKTKMRSSDPLVSPMRAAQNDPNIAFIVTFGHRPAYFSGSSTLKGYLDGLALLYSKYVLNLSGHDHEYGRTDPSLSYGVTHVLVGTGGEASYVGALKLHFTDAAIHGNFIDSAGAVQDTFSIVPGDTIPPTVSITSPMDNATISGMVTVSANADDGEGGSGVAGVQFKLDGAAVGAEDTTFPYAISWDSTTAANGVHTLSAQARDFGGYTATASIDVTVNNTISTLTFAPVADATIKSALPDTNYGLASTLGVDNSPVEHFLIKFDVSGLAGRTVTSAKLRLYNVNSSGMGGNFFRAADNGWTETGVNWSNAPASETPAIASLGAVSSSTWYEVALPLSLITDALNTAEHTFSLRVQSTSSNGAKYRTKENTAGFAPQLVVKVQQ